MANNGRDAITTVRMSDIITTTHAARVADSARDACYTVYT